MGSTLRGAFGYALKRITCTIPHLDVTAVLQKMSVYIMTFMSKIIVSTNTGFEIELGSKQVDFGTLTFF